jgi:DHA3 family macrolide efflux protein-like MFS transporter
VFPTQALSIRAFRNLWLGQAISQLGDAFYYVVFMFMVGQITGSSKMVGVTGAAEALPYLIFSAYAGVLADRLDRRNLMLYSDVFSGAVLVSFGLVVAVLPAVPGWTLVAIAFLLSCLRVFFMPAKNAAIPSLVPADMLMKANALSSITQSFAPMVGLFLSASVLALLYSWSKTWFFVAAIGVNAVSFFLSAAYIRLLPQIVPSREGEEKHPWLDFRQGLGYLKRHRVLRVFIVVNSLLGLMISPFFIVYVQANKEWFGGLPQTLCWFEFTFFAGLIVGSSLVAKFSHRRPGLGYSYALGVVGLCVAAMAVSRTLFLFCLWNVVCGLVVPFCDVPFMTYMQTAVEDNFRGRVSSVLNMARMGVVPLGMALGGFLVSTVGIVGAFLVMGFGMTGAALLGLASPDFRRAEIPDAPVLEASITHVTAEVA